MPTSTPIFFVDTGKGTDRLSNARKVETVESIFAFESWIARFNSSLDTPKEPLEGFVQSLDDVLKHMGMSAFVLWEHLLEFCELTHLLELSDTLILFLFKQHVVQAPT